MKTLEQVDRRPEPRCEVSERLARQFHDIYERLAPQFGYVTREETQHFEPTTPNGRLMIAVTDEIERATIPLDLAALTYTDTVPTEEGYYAAWPGKLIGNYESHCDQPSIWRVERARSGVLYADTFTWADYYTLDMLRWGPLIARLAGGGE